MICPRCQNEVPDAPECASCGIVVAKFLARKAKDGEVRDIPSPSEEKVPVGGTPDRQDSRKRPPERPWLLRPVSDGKLAGIYGQIARMLESGIALTEALGLIAGHSRGRLRATFASMRRAIEEGSTLSEAMALDTALFPDYVCSLVEAGEQTGGLPSVFRYLGEAIELRQGTRRRIMRACLYPFILFTLSFFLLPLSKLFTGGWGSYLGASLVPYSIALVCLALVVVILPWAAKKLLGPGRFRAMVHAVPVLGKLYRLRAKVRFCRHLSTSLSAGLDMSLCLRLSARASGDPSVPQKIEITLEGVKQGRTLTEAVGQAGLFDDEFMLALSSGEVSGRLDETLEQQARIGQEAFLHRLEVAVQLAAVAVLILVYAFVVWSILAEYRSMLGGYQQQIEQAMKGIGGSDAGLENLLKGVGGPMGSGQLPPELKDLLK